jgi:hypothetical protein
MEEAIARGPHQSALTPEALEHFASEIKEKVVSKQARVVEWDTIKDNPPPELKISPIAAIPHKSKAYRSILDLSFRLRLKNGGFRDAVNDTTVKTAPGGAIDQIGECLSRIIHAFAAAEEDAKIFMAKWDIKDGFWRMDCREGEEWNFAYVLPQPEGEPIRLVIPTSLQMGWVESPPYFCAATETARDIATTYIETGIRTLPNHKFEHYTSGAEACDTLPAVADINNGFRYALEVYVDDFISIVIPASQEQLRHVANAVMEGIHDVFPPDDDDGNDPISEKKLIKRDGQYDVLKTLLGFEFDGVGKTLWLEEAKREKILTTLHSWIRMASRGHGGIPFKQFETTIAKLRHSFTAIPAGVGLLSPCNRILAKKPPIVWLNSHKQVLAAIIGCRTLLRESTKDPTRCRELVSGWPDFIGIVDASSHGVGGVVMGEISPCIPTVFRWEWPKDVTASVRSFSNPRGTITNSDLEMAGVLILWLVMEAVCQPLQEKRVALFSDNSPAVGWTKRLASRKSIIAEHFVQALALRIKTNKTCPLTTLHIEGKRNSISDVPSRSFGSTPAWHCTSEKSFLTLFNSLFPLPLQNSWTGFRLNSKVVMRVISTLRTQHSDLEGWRRLPKIGNHVGTTGACMSNLWEWTHIYRLPLSDYAAGASWDTQHASDLDTLVKESKSKLAQSLAQSQPLARRSQWTQISTLSN